MIVLPEGISRLLLFDGHCNLCDFWVKFLLKADGKQRIHFAPLQSQVARKYRDYLPHLDLYETVVFIEPGRLATRSTAVLRILSALGGFWRVSAVFYLIPQFLRDPIYDFVAKRRYRWFGRREHCRIPTAIERERFLE